MQHNLEQRLDGGIYLATSSPLKLKDVGFLVDFIAKNFQYLSVPSSGWND
jgi:hypothetical protein